MILQNSCKGRIIKSTGGFYYVVDKKSNIFTCRARGIFRKDKISPLVGDIVSIVLENNTNGIVDKIYERKNFLVRPPLANIDQMAVVISIQDPVPNLYVVDKFLAILESKDIKPTIVITKSDLDNADDIQDIYSKAGYTVNIISTKTGEGVEDFKKVLKNKFSAFSGNSGVGKSSLLNALDPLFDIEVATTSKKLGRGKHTTRHVEIFQLENNALIADTPGFSSITVQEMSKIEKQDLQYYFIEFNKYIGKCKFVDCVHIKEKECAVINAVNSGEIAAERYENYKMLCEEIKDIKPWN